MNRMFKRLTGYLLRLLLPTKWKEAVRCGGWLQGNPGVKPCFRELKREDALNLTWIRGNQYHNIYFCSFKCLEGFLANSHWGK